MNFPLQKYITEDNSDFNHEDFGRKIRVGTRNMNKIIDANAYPIPETIASNFDNRPIALGVQGKADLLLKLKVPWESERGSKLNREISETIYYHALDESCNLAQIHGPYKNFQGSPLSKGIFQFDMWGVKPSPRYDWEALRTKIMKHGVRNSLVYAQMPAASTTQIVGSVGEAEDPITHNISTRKVLAGEFIVVNRYLVEDLIELGLWDKAMNEEIILNDGSVQNIERIPKHLKEVYKTVWEMSTKKLLDLTAERGAFIDQSQSTSLYIERPTFENVTSAHFYGWKKGLKTGMYYLRSRAPTEAVKFTISKDTFFVNQQGRDLPEKEETQMTSKEPSQDYCVNKSDCDSCGV
jgi:ribonucleotide reductase alpha subunit